MDIDADLKSKINITVDTLINILKQDLLRPKFDGIQKRGIWDRFKNWMSNLVYGRQSEKNPYYFVNTLGDFGGAKMPKNESCILIHEKLSIKEYKVLSCIYENFEIKLTEANAFSGTENLYIMTLLNDLAKNLKIALAKIVSDHMAILASTKEKPQEKITTAPKNITVEKPEEKVVNVTQSKEEKEGSETGKNIEKDKSEIPVANLDDLDSPVSHAVSEESEEFPFNQPSNKDGIKEIMKQLRHPKYRNKLENWENKASEIDKDILENFKSNINDILEEKYDDVSKIKKIIDDFKVFIYHIIKEKIQNDNIISFESHISHLYALSLKEKNEYLKELLIER